MVLLGIDPGLAQTGYGVVEYQHGRFRPLALGVIRTRACDPLPQRLAAIFRRVDDLLKQHTPQTMVMERLYALRDGSTGLAIGQAMGVILLASELARVDVAEYTPTQVKRAVVGYGQATKEQVQYMIQRLLDLREPPSPSHAADALALCVCHVHSSGPAQAESGPGSGALPPLASRVAAALEQDQARRAAHRRRRSRGE